MRILLAFFAVALAARAADSAGGSAASAFEAGYRNMYDLKFDDAHRVFAELQRAHPEDPFAHVSDAAAFLFSEFARLHILEAEFFLDDRGFRDSRDLPVDPKLKLRFEQSLENAERLADAALARSASDKNALFSKVMIFGLRSDYAGMIERRYLAALPPLKSGRIWAQKLLAIDPKFGDAYLAGGVENYILSLKPAVLRWALRMYGSETDASRGVQNLRQCLEYGRYMKPFARLLLAVAAVREKNYGTARELLFGLAKEFPNNPLYAQQAAKLPN